MEQIIGERENERDIIERIKREYDLEILREDSDDSIAFLIREDEIHSVNMQDNEVLSLLRLMPRVAALRRNPSATGAKRPPCMADIARVGTNLISEAVTKEPYRGMQFMRKLMSGALAYQNQMQVPLCFVETGGEEQKAEFLRQFGFQYIYDSPHYKLNMETISEEMLERAAKGETVYLGNSSAVLQVVAQEDMLSLAHFVNARLCRNYGFFVIRNAAYYEQFQKKLQKDGGDLFQIMEGGARKGCFAYINEPTECISEVVFEKDSERERYLITVAAPKPAVMARIVNMSELLKHVSGNGKITIAMRIKDPAIIENDGLFIWYIDAEGSHVERVGRPVDALGEDPSMRPEVETTIGAFTAFIFDYIKLKQNVKFDSIYLAGPVWINEKY